MPPPSDPLDRFTRAAPELPILYVFMCGCRRLVRRDGPKIALCIPERNRPCLDPRGRGQLASDDELRDVGLDPEQW